VQDGLNGGGLFGDKEGQKNTGVLWTKPERDTKHNLVQEDTCCPIKPKVSGRRHRNLMQKVVPKKRSLGRGFGARMIGVSGWRLSQEIMNYSKRKKEK